VTTDPQTATILKTNASSLSAKVEVPAYIWAPIGQGQTVGEVRYYIGSDCVASVPVYTTQAVDACAPATTGQRFVALLAALLRQVLVG